MIELFILILGIIITSDNNYAPYGKPALYLVSKELKIKMPNFVKKWEKHL